MKTTFKYDHYYKFAEIKSNLDYFAEKYPELCTVEVNCVTAKGLNQYAVTLTNKKTGDALSKPGWYLDGNIHAGEVTSCMAAMHTIDYLLTNYGTDADCTKLLDTETIYVIPRITPDGAETYLTTPYTLRSVDRDYLPEKGGMMDEDLDGDGAVRAMRIPTPYGAWKIDAEGNMVLRTPSDTEGTFYDVYNEGMLEAFEGDENLKKKKADWGNDFNRNFPLGWFPEYRQPGAGLCHPETKAVADFVLAHPNIGGAACGHTSGGIILYPPGTKPSAKASQADMKAFIAIAKMGEEETAYKPMNIFDNFMLDQENFSSGAVDDWFYQNLGIPAYTIEFWDVNSKAGVPFNWFDHSQEGPEKSMERFHAIQKWVKENAPESYIEWTPFDHPQFGKVEIGGFNSKFTHQNPPAHLLTKECENDTKFNIRFAKSMPKLVIDSVKSEDMGNGVYKVTAVVGNVGYLSTNLTEEALNIKVAKPVMACIEGAEMFDGCAEACLGNLDGFSKTVTGIFYGGNIQTMKNAQAKKKVSWMVKAAPGTKVTVKACHEKAGTACAEVTL